MSPVMPVLCYMYSQKSCDFIFTQNTTGMWEIDSDFAKIHVEMFKKCVIQRIFLTNGSVHDNGLRTENLWTNYM